MKKCRVPWNFNSYVEDEIFTYATFNMRTIKVEFAEILFYITIQDSLVQSHVKVYLLEKPDSQVEDHSW